jgi:hypothetical protein
LPDSLAIPRLIFQFAARRADKNSEPLTESLIALGRLGVEDRWPAYLAIDELSPERQAYAKAYVRVKAQSLEGKLNLGAILKLSSCMGCVYLGREGNHTNPTRQRGKSTGDPPWRVGLVCAVRDSTVNRGSVVFCLVLLPGESEPRLTGNTDRSGRLGEL